MISSFSSWWRPKKREEENEHVFILVSLSEIPNELCWQLQQINLMMHVAFTNLCCPHVAKIHNCMYGSSSLLWPLEGSEHSWYLTQATVTVAKTFFFVCHMQKLHLRRFVHCDAFVCQPLSDHSYYMQFNYVYSCPHVIICAGLTMIVHGKVNRWMFWCWRVIDTVWLIKLFQLKLSNPSKKDISESQSSL